MRLSYRRRFEDDKQPGELFIDGEGRVSKRGGLMDASVTLTLNGHSIRCAAATKPCRTFASTFRKPFRVHKIRRSYAYLHYGLRFRWMAIAIHPRYPGHTRPTSTQTELRHAVAARCGKKSLKGQSLNFALEDVQRSSIKGRRNLSIFFFFCIYRLYFLFVPVTATAHKPAKATNFRNANYKLERNLRRALTARTPQPGQACGQVAGAENGALVVTSASTLRRAPGLQ